MATHTVQSALPPLIFGARSSAIHHSTERLLEALRTTLPKVIACENLNSSQAHFNNSCLATLGDLKLLAIACSSTRITAEAQADTILMLPFSGNGSIRSGRKTVTWKTGFSAVWLPKCDLICEGSTQSAVYINLDSNRIERVTRVMLGMAMDQPLPTEPPEPCELLLKVGRISFDTVFRLLASSIDQFILQPELLALCALDDNVYRNAIMMRYPSLFLAQETSTLRTVFARRRLDHVCQYIQANLSHSITLTDLERTGLMSRRNLHYAFQNRYDCSPMQWVREERLAFARTLLMMASVGDTVTNIAYQSGFNKSSTFSTYYKTKYGELPSLTLTQALAR